MKKFYSFIFMAIGFSVYSSDHDQWIQEFKKLTAIVANQKTALETVLSLNSQRQFSFDISTLDLAMRERQKLINQTISNINVLTIKINSTLPQREDQVQLSIDNSDNFSVSLGTSLPLDSTISLDSQLPSLSSESSISDISLSSDLSEGIIRSRANSRADTNFLTDIHSIQDNVTIMQQYLEEQLVKEQSENKKLFELACKEYIQIQKQKKHIENQRRAQQSLFDTGRYVLDQQKSKQQNLHDKLYAKFNKDQQRYQSWIKQEKKEKERQDRLKQQQELKQQENQMIQEAIFLSKLENQLQKNGLKVDQLPEIVVRHAIKISQLQYPQSFAFYHDFNDHKSEIDQHVVQPTTESWIRSVIARTPDLTQEQIGIFSGLFESVFTQALLLRYQESV